MTYRMMTFLKRNPALVSLPMKWDNFFLINIILLQRHRGDATHGQKKARKKEKDEEKRTYTPHHTPMKWEKWT